MNPFEYVGVICWFHSMKKVDCAMCDEKVDTLTMFWGMAVPHGIYNKCLEFITVITSKIPYEFRSRVNDGNGLESKSEEAVPDFYV